VNMSVPTGATVRLHCSVTNVEIKAVSWIRLSDYQILTNGLKTFTTDRRFSLLHSPGGSEWTLQIQSVKHKDQGGYQCQAATKSGVRTLTSWLWVNKPYAAILGSREKLVNIGESVTIICELMNNVQEPDFVFWYHNNSMINFQSGVRVNTFILGPDPDSLWVAPPNTTVSKLTIARTRQDQAGNYTCAPSNIARDSIRLTISKGKYLTKDIS
jgi:neurotrimin